MFRHGSVECSRCWDSSTATVQEEGSFRLVRDPGHWGASNPETLVLGMSKGNTQSSAYRTECFDRVAFKGMRHRILQCFQSVGLLANETLERFERRFVASEKDFAFASMVRCSLTGFDRKKGKHTADSPNVLPAFKPSVVGHRFVQACVEQHLVRLPSRTSRVLLLGNTDSYVKAVAAAMSRQRGEVVWINPMAYKSADVWFVHLAHPSPGNGHFGAYIRGEGKPGLKRNLAREALTLSN
ncbi:hypothetical protein GRI38_01735 [Altererythrobacter aurantiacus]|uniref:Uncharacterized protein n=1 Tax=Parapontixanthobacter aurantiacus TaxID=1463599 RepID=A0A844ZA23_9SPHN|nr:hypothetical protein [Parapontixanthobacter aurantiacus]